MGDREPERERDLTAGNEIKRIKMVSHLCADITYSATSRRAAERAHQTTTQHFSIRFWFWYMWVFTIEWVSSSRAKKKKRRDWEYSIHTYAYTPVTATHNCVSRNCRTVISSFLLLHELKKQNKNINCWFSLVGCVASIVTRIYFRRGARAH